MTTATSTKEEIRAADIHSDLSNYILTDGLEIILDLERSHGTFLYDSLRGREVLDMFTCFSTAPLGYNHPKLMTPQFRERILPAALNKPSNSDFYTTQFAEFVKAFAQTVPSPLRQHLFFIEGGALAVENALKAAFDWKTRKNLKAGRAERGSKIVHFKHAFHGRSGYTLSLTNTADPRKTEYFPKFDWPRVTNPGLKFPQTAESLVQVEAAEKQAIAEIEQALTEHPHEIAGLIIEPIQGEGGDNHFRSEFLQDLRRLADENEFLLIFDEVQTGFGTTGSWWCFEQLNVTPDLLAFGKKSQVCGICAGSRLDEIESVFEVSSRINSTWGGNLVDMVRCQRIIEIIDGERLLENARDIGARLLNGLRGLEETFQGQVSNARGRGMFLAFDLPSGEIRDNALKALNSVDLLGLASGAEAIRFRPPLSMTAEEADEGLKRLEQALSIVL
jgi:L-lysine 6-transaminase